MRMILTTAACFLAAITFTTPAAAQTGMEPYELLVGSWEGELEYLNYGDNLTLVTLPTRLLVEPAGNGRRLDLEFIFVEPDGSEVSGTDQLYETPDGLYFGDRWTVEEQEVEEPGRHLRLVLSRDGEDDNRAASIRTLVALEGDELTITKRVQYTDTGEELQRNQYRFRRSGSQLAGQVAKIVAPYETARDFMGVVGVQRLGAAPLLAPSGYASMELEVPHGPDGIFMIGSISKQFTAVAVLLLEEDGRLSTDDPVGMHVDEFAALPDVSIHQLLTHTGAVTDIYSLARFGNSGGQVGTFDEVIADLAEAGLTGEPGAGYAYSNGGYALLAAAIERVSGMSYGEFLERRLFQPLGLSSMASDAPGPAVPGRVPGYDPWGTSDLIPAPTVAPGFLVGSGSLWSSTADLLQWALALHGGEILAPDSYAKLVTDHGNGYGYGVSVFTRFGRATIGHDGRVSGYASDLAYYPEEDLVIAVLGNVQSVARDEIRRLVAGAVFGEELEVPKSRQFATAIESLDELVGRYSFGPGFVVSVSESDGRLMARANEGGSSELVPLGDSVWFSRMLYATVRFERNSDGAVDRLVWGTGANAPAGERLP